MANSYVTTNTELTNAVATDNGTAANDSVYLQNNITLTADDVLNLNSPNGSGTLRLRGGTPANYPTTGAPANPTNYTLTVVNSLVINDTDKTSAQPSFAIGPLTLVIGDGSTAGGISGNLRVDDGGILAFNRSVDTTYTGTLTVEDDDNAVINKVAGTTVTFDGSARGTNADGTTNPIGGTNPTGVAIRASQGTGDADAYELEIGGAGDGVVSGIIADGGFAYRPGDLVKTGDGTWTFSGANTYVGTTTIEQGTLVISNAAGLGATIGAQDGTHVPTTDNPHTAAAAGTIVVDGATLALTGGIAIGAEALTLGAAGDDDAGGTGNADDDAPGLLNLTGNNSFGGAITLASDATIESRAGSLTLTGGISGVGAVDDQGTAFNPGLTLDGDAAGSITGVIDANVGTVTKGGDGFWTLSGENAYVGTTTVEEGTLVISNSSALGATDAGTVVEDGATLSLEANNATGPLTVAENLTLSGEGALGDDSGESAAGALSNEAGDNLVTGNITLAADSTIKSEGGSLTLSGTVIGAFGLTLDGDANGTLSGAIGSDVTTLTKNGDGTWNLTSDDNAYTGGTFLNKGTLELGTMASAGTGAITFGDDDQMLRLDASGTLSNVITNFEDDDTIDLRTIDSDGATYTIDGNKLTITEAATKGNDSVTLTFADDIPDNFSAVLGSDGQGGTTVTLDDITAPDMPDAPTLAAASDTGTSSSDRVTRDDTPTLTGVAEAGSTVTLYDGDNAVGTAHAGEDGAYTVTASQLGNGQHSLSVTATDARGNESESSRATVVTIDTQIVAPTLSLATTSDSGRSSSDRITKATTPVITGNGEIGSVVSVFDGTKLIGSATVGANGTFTFTSPVLADGVHNLSAIAVDAAGNFSQVSPVLSLTIDTKAPIAPAAPTLAAASDSGISSSDRVTNVQAPTFTGTAEAGSTINLYDGTKIVGTALTASNGTYSVTASTLAAGAHSIKVTATDAAGNVGPASAAIAVTIDTAAPTAPLAPTLVAASDTGRSATDAITMDITPSVTGRAEAGATVRLYDGTSTVVLGSAVAASNGVYVINPTVGLSDGPHSLTVTATDKAGNVSGRSPGKAVTIDTSAPNAPSKPIVTADSDTGRSTTDAITKDTTPTVTGTAEAGSIVTLYDGSKAIGSAAVVSGTYTITSAALVNGSHTLSAKATDAAGNVSSASSPTTVVIDTVAPVAPKVTLANDTGDSATDAITKDPTLAITAEAGSTLLYSTDNKTYTATAPVFATNGTADGAHTVYVKAVDAAGNIGPAGSRTFTLDTKAPVVTATNANNGSFTTQSNQTIAGTGEAGTTVVLYDNSNVVGTTTVASNGKWSKAITLSEGTNKIVATDFDKAGNVGMSNTLSIDYTSTSLNRMAQAMSTMTSSSSSAMTPTASSGSEAHPQLAASHG